MTKTFKQAFYFFRINLLKLLAYTLSIAVLVILIAQLLIPIFFGDVSVEEIGAESIKAFAQVMNLVIQPIYVGGLIALIYSLATEQSKGVFNCLLEGIKRWPYMLLANVITSFLIFAGFLLFVLPGIWLFTRLFLVPYLVMLKKQTPFEAITNSFVYTKGYSMSILVDIILLVIISFIFLLILSVLQLLYPYLLLFFLLLFQSMAYVLYYRHYEILMEANIKSLEDKGEES